MKKKLILLSAVFFLVGSKEIFAQSGNEPKLAAASANKSGHAGSKPAGAGQPELAAAKSTSTNNQNTKSLSQKRVENKPQLAAGQDKNGTLYPVKK